MIAPPPLPATNQSASKEDDSDSDWDDDDDLTSRKINIVIKPIAQLAPTNISASVDELRSAVGSWKTLTGPNRVQSSCQVDVAQNRDFVKQYNDQDGYNNQPIPVTSTAVPRLSLLLNPIDSQVESSLKNISTIDQKTNPPIPPATAPKSLIIPVAFALQETLEVKSSLVGAVGGLSTGVSLKGRIKLAVPPELMAMEVPRSHKLMNFELVTSCLKETTKTIKVNQNFIRQSENNNNNSSALVHRYSSNIVKDNLDVALSEPSSINDFLLDVEAAQSYVRQRFKNHSTYAKYFILPELVQYEFTAQSSVGTSNALNPLDIKTKMTCELNLTKIRIDLSLCADPTRLVSAHEIQDLSLSLKIDGQVRSFQCKPEAVWNSGQSRLTWNFSSLAELIHFCHGEAPTDSNASCMGLFEMNAGPSTPSDVNVQFSIKGKSLSGAQVHLDESDGRFRIAMQKLDVRTGSYRCAANMYQQYNGLELI